jgi:hypothetical protein
MSTDTTAFCSAKRQVADMMRFASAQIGEKDFDPGLPQRVLWSKDFGVSVEDFADYFALGVPWWIFVWSYWSRRMFFGV